MENEPRQGEVAQEEEPGEISEISEYPVPFDNLLELIKKPESPEVRERLEELVENVRQACFRYSETLSRLADIKTQRDYLKGKEFGETLNELELSCSSALRVLEDSLNILSRNMGEGGADNKWRGEFYIPGQMGDWATRVVANKIFRTHKEFEKNYPTNKG
jgi:hypothetical protein